MCRESQQVNGRQRDRCVTAPHSDSLLASMEIDFSYSFTDHEALSRLQALGTYLTNRHGISVTWLDETRARFSGKYMVVNIEGELSLGSGRAVFKGKDPGFLWRKRAAEYIRGKLEAYLDPSVAVADLPVQ